MKNGLRRRLKYLILHRLEDYHGKLLSIAFFVSFLFIIQLGFFVYQFRPVSDLEIHVIDIGQGDSILFRHPSGVDFIVDTGPNDSLASLKRHLKNQGIGRLDFAIGTHPDEDHIGNVDWLMKNIRVNTLYVPPQKTGSMDFFNMVNSARKSSTPIKTLRAGQSLRIDKDTTIDVLSPRRIAPDDNNKNSIVFLMRYKDCRLFFTGDADSEVEREVLSHYNVGEVDFLKVGHHGSKTASCKEFIRALRPKISAISCGYRNKFGHPHRVVLENLMSVHTKIFRTDTDGTLIFHCDGKNIYK